MIVRIFQVTVHPGKEAEFSGFFYQTAIPLMKSTAGIVTLIPCAPRPETPREFAFVMVWESLAALKDFVGEDYDSPHIHPDEARLVESRTIKHYVPVADA